MKSKLLLIMLLLAVRPPDLFSQRSYNWSRIPESIKKTEVFERFQADYRQRAYPYDTIPATHYRDVLKREIRKIKTAVKSNTVNCEWRSLGPAGFDGQPWPWGFISGRVKALAVHPTNPDIIYIGAASGGIWKTTNGGSSWQDIGKDLVSLNFGAIAIDPNNPQIVYAGSGEACLISIDVIFDGKGMFKSTDGGQNWTVITNGFGDRTHFGDIVVDPVNPNIVLAAIASGNFFRGDSLTNEGIWRSTDAGLTWTRTLPGFDAYDIVFHPFNTSTVYGTLGGYSQNAGFYISTDAGSTWTRSNTGLPPAGEIGRMQIDIAKSSPNILYSVIYQAVDNVTQSTRAFKSTDGGLNWIQVSAGIPLCGFDGASWYDQGFYDLCIAVDPVNPNHVFIGNVELHETNNGADFSPVRPFGSNLMGGLAHCDYHRLVYAASNPYYFYIGCDGGIFRSTDGGSTAVSLNQGLMTLQFYRIASSPFDSLIFMGGMQDNGSVLTKNGGASWFLVTGGDGMECFFDYADPTIVYASIQWGMFYYSSNGGNSFVFLGNFPGSWTTPFFMHPTDHTWLYTATNNVYRDPGTWFTVISYDVVPYPAYVTCMAQSRVNPDNMILTSGGFAELIPLSADSLFRVKISTDGGFNWNDVTASIPGETRWFGRVAPDPVDENTMYVLKTGFSPGNKLYKTTDLGLTWTNLSGDLPDLPCNDIFIDPLNTDYLYVATDIGVYRSPNGGSTWEYQGGGIPLVPVLDFDYVVFGQKRLLRIGTHGRSVWETTLDNSVGTGRIQNNSFQVSNYPNPFTDLSTFNFILKEPAEVTLQIFNVYGQIVAEPLNSSFISGEQKFQWNSGGLPPGIYYYRLRAGEAARGGKMVKL